MIACDLPMECVFASVFEKERNRAMNAASNAIRALLVREGTRVPIHGYWQIGTIVVNSTLLLNHGERTAEIKKLADDAGVKPNTLEKSRQLRQTWTEEEARAADAAGLAWRNVIVLLRLSNRADQLRENARGAEGDRLQRLAEELAKARMDFVRKVGSGELAARDFLGQVKQWVGDHEEHFRDRLDRSKRSMRDDPGF